MMVSASMTVAQRFGSALNLNLHFHVLALDGLHCEDPDDGTVRWFRSPAPTDLEVSTLVEQIADRAGGRAASRNPRLHPPEFPHDSRQSFWTPHTEVTPVAVGVSSVTGKPESAGRSAPRQPW